MNRGGTHLMPNLALPHTPEQALRNDETVQSPGEGLLSEVAASCDLTYQHAFVARELRKDFTCTRELWDESTSKRRRTWGQDDEGS